ncbi:MAG: hypothetical protein KAW88_07580 [Candidatus Cloacimonetes bacterium]|nr:hypothetical protein [Candidatus Cloacimonadota bacterium]
MQKEKIGLLICLFLMFFTTFIQAEIIHENVNYSNGSYNWYAAHNPHIVIGYVQINDNAGLTIFIMEHPILQLPTFIGEQKFILKLKIKYMIRMI